VRNDDRSHSGEGEQNGQMKDQWGTLPQWYDNVVRLWRRLCDAPEVHGAFEAFDTSRSGLQQLDTAPIIVDMVRVRKDS